MLCLITYCKVCSKHTVCYSETTKDLLRCSDYIKTTYTLDDLKEDYYDE